MPAEMRWAILHATNDRFLIGVIGIVHDDSGRVLVLEHRFRTPHAWGLPGGYINHGETFGAGLVREIKEEVGIDIAIEREHEPPFDTELTVPGHYVTITLLARARTTELSFSSEIAGGRFFGEGELPEGTYPHHRDLIHRFWSSLHGREKRT
jgi:8-oxo-dGTP pyrophosphatase MutT (NUDIX family)